MRSREVGKVTRKQWAVLPDSVFSTFSLGEALLASCRDPSGEPSFCHISTNQPEERKCLPVTQAEASL